MSELKISVRMIGPKELDPNFKREGLPQVDLPGYIPVYQWGYARMDPSTPGKGISTSGLVSCICVVLHCRETKRTIVTHSPNYMSIPGTFSPLVEWIIGGNPNPEPMPDSSVFPLQSMIARLQMMSARTGSTGHKIHAVVIRGSSYATPIAVTYGHGGWMSDFREFFDRFGPVYSMTADVLDCPVISPAGALIVDKETADITFLDIDPSCNVSKQLFRVVDSSIPADDQYTPIQQMQDLFVGSLLVNHSARDSPGISLQYDVNHYLLPLKLTDEARYLIRSKDLREPQAAQSRILKEFGLSDDWFAKKNPQAFLTRETFQNLMLAGPVCENCGKRGSKKCSECKAAWYCSVDHQRQDWRIHKAWCRAHKLAK